MKLIKVYDKDMNPLTTFTEVDFNALRYRTSIKQIGDFQFDLEVNNTKTNNINIELYNRIEIIEDGNIVFLGVITRNTIDLNTVTIQGKHIVFILKKRILNGEYSINGNIGTGISAILSLINGVDDTGISAGDYSSITGTVNNTWKNSDVYSIVDDICKATGHEFIVDNQGILQISTIGQIGEDKSDDILLQYNYNQVASANILTFNVENDGEKILTKMFGQSGGLTSTQESTVLKNQFGVLEGYKNFRVINDQQTLDDFTNTEIQDRLYSPDLSLAPSVEDNFNVGDVVRILLKNPLINIDDDFQILEKRVQYNKGQKEISIRINEIPFYIAQILNERDRRLALLEKEV